MDSAVVAALVALGGTILGAVIALGGSALVASREQRTREIDRAIEMRLAVYAEFLQTANVALASFVAQGSPDRAVADRFLLAFDRLRLVASPDVERIAAIVHLEFGSILKCEYVDSLAQRKTLGVEMSRAIGSFVSEAKADLRSPRRLSSG